MAIEVMLLDHTSDPLKTLYTAFRVCYSALTPPRSRRASRTSASRASRCRASSMHASAPGHASPLQQVWFEFGISGVSRAFSHQFVRHHMGISFEQQSQRYVTYKDGSYPYTVPESVRRAGKSEAFEEAIEAAGNAYLELVESGVPAEDARFLLPNATNTNFKVSVNYLELLHIADLRLCTRAQWEFRKVVAMMRAEVKRAFPELAQYIQPKCGEFRLGYCDEDYEAWEACPLGAKRPHKRTLFELYDRALTANGGSGRGLGDLDDRDFEIIEIEQIGEAAEQY